LATTETRSPVEGPVVTVTADDAAGAALTHGDDRRLAGSQPSVKGAPDRGGGHRIHDTRSSSISSTEVTAFHAAKSV